MQIVPDLKTHDKCAFLHPRETFIVRFSGGNNIFQDFFGNHSVNYMSGKCFSYWIVDQKAVEQLACLIFPSLVSVNPLGCLECFLFDIVVKWGDYTDTAMFSVSMPKLAKAIPTILQLWVFSSCLFDIKFYMMVSMLRSTN